MQGGFKLEMEDVLKYRIAQIEGLFLLLDHGNTKGLSHWADELERRQIPAVITVEEHMVESNGSVIRNLSNRGFEIGGGFEQPFWEELYEYQYEKISSISDKIQSCTDKPMRILGSKYFAYNETTLQVADKIGIECVLARGTAGPEAIIYKPREYQAKIVSVSNVPSKGMGTGSLCDESLFSRGEAPDDFRDILFSLTVNKIVLVAQTHLSGVKLNWWNVYQDFLNKNVVAWKPWEEFVTNAIELPNEQIPINREVKYVTPKPKIPLEQEMEYPFKKGVE